jgi:hypothetical protein
MTPDVLYYYRCRICAGIIITGQEARGYEPCNGCQSYAKLMFSEPVTTPEQRKTAEEVAHGGRVFRFSPSREPLKFTPSLIDYGPVSTPEQRAAAAAEDEERMEAAHRAAEERQ